MRKKLLVIVAVSLKQKTLAFAAGPSPYSNPRRSTQQIPEARVSNLLSVTKRRRSDDILSNNRRAAILLQGGASKEGSKTVDDDHGRAATISSNQNVLASSSLLSLSQISSSNYYLIWSPGFLRKFVLAGAGIWGIHGLLQWDIRVASMLSQQWKSWNIRPPSTAAISSRMKIVGATQNVVLPLLSSSCCLLQLLINALVGAGGCAGFNTLLGPVRPVFLALLVGLNVWTGASIRQSLWRYAFALMPEGVYCWNELAKRQWRNKVMAREEVSRQLDNDGPVGKAAPKLRATILVDIPTMGCVACINKIDSSLRNCAPDQILEASSWLDQDSKGGSARLDVLTDSEDDLNALSHTVVNAIERAGFEGSVVTDLHILPETTNP